MLYRPFGNTGIQVSILGFGAMRLPYTEVGGVSRPDYDESGRMMRRAYELGVNYFDTAPKYCDGESEAVVGRALAGIRDKVYLSTKYSVGKDACADDCRRSLEASLKALCTDYIDFYHMWAINLEKFETLVAVPGGPLEAAERARDEGLIRHISFSFHDSPENLMKIAECGRFETVLAQYNLLDRSNEEGFRRARAMGMGTVVMGPVAGGRLGVASETISSAIPGGARSNPELALRFVLANPDVCCALSGMSTLQQVEENCAAAARGDFLNPAEIQAVNAAMEENRKLAELYCTGCGYCMPCPAEVNIPLCFRLMNYHRVYGITDYARETYGKIGVNPFLPGKTADACVGCGVCEEKCPQKLEIRRQLAETHAALG